MAYYITLDVGGSHISSSLIFYNNLEYRTEQKAHRFISSTITASQFIDELTESILCVSKPEIAEPLKGIGISMPGPMDYQNGICKITGVNKFEALFGLDLKTTLACRLTDLQIGSDQILIMNDGQAFLLGVLSRDNLTSNNALAITVGTGFGSASYADGTLYSGLFDENYLYNSTFKNGRAEDYFSTNWFLEQAVYLKLNNGVELNGVKSLADKWEENENVQLIFQKFGKNLAEYLNYLTAEKEIDRIIFGGDIFKSFDLFEHSFRDNFRQDITVQVAENTSELSILGVALYCSLNLKQNKKSVRDSVSSVLPLKKDRKQDSGYDIYPSFSLENDSIKEGFKSLSDYINRTFSDKLIIDGNVGTCWPDIIHKINTELAREGKKSYWFNVDAALKNEVEINSMLESNLGGNDPLFGFKYDGGLEDFFNNKEIQKIKSVNESISIIYGTGAALVGWDAPIIYVDQPKNEIQYRSRAGSVTNLGVAEPADPKDMYKRFYFVDWPVCNKHKETLLSKISIFVDGQRPDTITWTTGDRFRTGLYKMAKSPFKVRPWFEPGVWGGRWMQNKFEGLNKDAENFAWSFEIIAPENGIIFESDGWMLEAGFEFLMAADNRAILGSHAEICGHYFPIRFDYLDTMDGENLSLQCHPRLKYIQTNFGEKFTQDETYYMMDTKPGSQVYLGFQENINPNEFEKAVRKSEDYGSKLDVDHFVKTYPANKHDLFLIPAGTIHCSGDNNVVLEISNTPYIFTFKIYDWQRLDLDGKPRTLNVDRALDNLNFEIKGQKIDREYISKPKTVEQGNDWKLINLPTHEDHLYAIQRMEFENSVNINTENQFHVLNLVEGLSIEIESEQRNMVLHYGETVVIPAAAGKYTLINRHETTAKVVKAFMK